MQPPQAILNVNHPPPLVRRPAVLLIDSDRQRQFGRAAGLRMQGVTVTCADTGADAYALWDAALYQLVLIDFRGADSAVHSFYRYLQALPKPQSVGLYCSTSPFLMRATGGTAPPPEGPPSPSREQRQQAFDDATRRDTVGGGLMHAARRIAAVRPRRAAPASTVPKRPERGTPESAASIADRVLGGGH